LAATASALAESKSAAEFALKTCLRAMDDVGKVDVMARENKWFMLPPNPVANPPLFKSHTHWVAGRYSVTTWINEKAGNSPHCLISLFRNEDINLDEFFATLSASLKLEFVSENNTARLRIVTYDVTSTPGNIQLNMAIQLDGTMFSAAFYKVMRTPPDLPVSR
jgi:hypothetical protein